METIRSTSLFPQRLTQLFADTKKSYENVVQTRHEGPELSSLHRKLRIQKDRLLAWGLEWSDANAAQAGDIDGSLDRAGISDLVASIMDFKPLERLTLLLLTEMSRLVASHL